MFFRRDFFDHDPLYAGLAVKPGNLNFPKRKAAVGEDSYRRGGPDEDPKRLVGDFISKEAKRLAKYEMRSKF